MVYKYATVKLQPVVGTNYHITGRDITIVQEYLQEFASGLVRMLGPPDMGSVAFGMFYQDVRHQELIAYVCDVLHDDDLTLCVLHIDV